MTNKSEMKMRVFKRTLLCTALMTAMGQASAATFDLCAGTKDIVMPDGVTTITMWGYGTDTGGACVPSIPGPRLTVPPGDATLTINLRNELSEPVSVIVPALSSTEVPAPVKFDNGDGTNRMRAFSIVKEAAANGGTNSYSFNAKPGTYLYQSGSHMSVQVQMGLYGMATQDFAAGQAYDGVPYDNEVTLVYSEIDPALHAAVANGSYGGAAMPSAVHFHAKYYLVNGAPYTGTTADISGPVVGQKTLVRMANAGLEPHVPFILNGSMSVISEYGHLYPYARDQFAVLMVPQQTRDAILAPTSAGRMAIYDRRLRLTNNVDAGAGGLMSFINVAAATGNIAPTATGESYNAVEGVQLAVAAPGVLANDTDLDGDPLTAVLDTDVSGGTLALSSDGSFTYTANVGTTTDSFTYHANDGAANSNVVTVNISVTAPVVNSAPVAVADSYSVVEGNVLTVAAPGVLGNDTDVNGDALTAALDTDVTAGTLVFNADGSFSYTPNAGTTSDSFTYHANDGALDSGIVTVTITVTPPPPPPANVAPVAADDYLGTVTRNLGTSTANSIANFNIVANDTDSDGTIDATSVVITTQPKKGTVVNNGDGTVTYTPTGGKAGSDTFAYTVNDNNGATSNVATVRVDIVK